MKSFSIENLHRFILFTHCDDEIVHTFFCISSNLLANPRCLYEQMNFSSLLFSSLSIENRKHFHFLVLFSISLIVSQGSISIYLQINKQRHFKTKRFDSICYSNVSNRRVIDEFQLRNFLVLYIECDVQRVIV